MQNLLYEDAIKKLNSMKENKVIENQVREINEILFLNGLSQDEDFIIASRYKSEESIEEKLVRKSYKYLDQLTDLAGIKIVFKDLDTTMKACEILKENLEIVKEDDYYKDKRNTGYKSIHFNFEDGDGNILELQVKDKLNDLKQQYCHSNIYKNILITEEYKDKLNNHMNSFIEKFYTSTIGNRFNLLYEIKENETRYFNTELRQSESFLKKENKSIEKQLFFKEKIKLKDLELLTQNTIQSKETIDFEEKYKSNKLGKNNR